ncbi:MAG: type II CAAX endopeptidase family protein [Candidatus Omnitrophota bacterium]|nr:type II CAAX endopeptidase family protein [Candidatus Omnitrophota bacterium]
MKKISEIIKGNRIYVFLLVFVILINFLVFLGWMAERAGKRATPSSEQVETAEEETQPKKMTMFDEEEIQARQKRLKALVVEKPLLYLFLGLLNLMTFFAIFIGILLDAYFVMRWFCRKPVNIRLMEQETPKWSVGDVARVILIFLSSGYAFVILQGFVAKQFPILFNDNFRMILNTVMMNAAGIGVIVYFIVKKYGQDLNAIGITSKKIVTGVFYAVVGYIALLPVLLAIMLITFFVTKLLEYRPPVQPIVQVFIEEKETSVLLLSAVFAAVFGPIAEEIFFRGFMYSAVKKRFGIFRSMLITSAIFSFLHTHIVGFLPIMMLGMLLAFLYEKTGSLIPSITVHIIHNLGMVVLVFLMRFIGT